MISRNILLINKLTELFYIYKYKRAKLSQVKLFYEIFLLMYTSKILTVSHLYSNHSYQYESTDIIVLKYVMIIYEIFLINANLKSN